MRPGELERLLRGALGETVMALLGDMNVTDVWLNPDGGVFVDGSGGRRCVEGLLILAENREKAGRLLASGVGKEFSEAEPSLSGDFGFDVLGRFRLQGFWPPVVRAVSLIFRRLAPKVYPLFGAEDGYLEKGILSREGLAGIELAMRARKNILLVGDMSSGKTTFANGVLHHIKDWGPSDRIVVLEDTPELQVSVPNCLALQSSDSLAPLESLCRAAFRTGGTRIVVGEVRGPEALQLLLLWAGGHGGGLATMHGSDAESALLRLNGLAQIASAASQHELIAAAISLVIQITRDANGVRRVQDPVWIHGYGQGKFDLRRSPPGLLTRNENS